jgi:hypothetical protein
VREREKVLFDGENINNHCKSNHDWYAKANPNSHANVDLVSTRE